ncbi:thioredoxin fold domain-containing protein [Vibrio gallicus]|uniref:thioredoxin fold domain-containing protein n=1 Tax=Vibrio gallicus TaxID=190897 RepID=UPI0021C40A3F|nr:thioredoxin fold domain-containing protein [Vibrio gallicus]
MKYLSRTLGLLLCSMLVFKASAADFDQAQLKQRFEKIGVTILHVEQSEMPGVVEVTTDQGTFYSSLKGDYFIPGKLYSLDDKGNFKDVAALRNGPKFAKLFSEHKDDMVIYKAKNEKYVVTVFTDISCGYCHKLHSEMQQYNDLGITIRYMAFPRAGAASDIGHQMASIWCSDDPKQAMDDVKLRGKAASVPADKLKQCQQIIVEQHKLGRAVGVTGTPSVFTPNGINVGGYLPPKALLERLQAEDKS